MSYIEDAPVRATSSNMGEVVFEWLPTMGPGVSDGDWCDITPYVTGGKTSCGRNYELDQFDTGSMTLDLETFDRLFDPEYTSGPFYPWLVPMRQIRASAVYGGTRYPVWRGFITDYGQTVESDKKYMTTLSCKDAKLVLEQIKLPSSAWAMEIVKDDPDAWFRVGETDTVRATDNSTHGNYGLYDNCQQGVEGLVKNDADGAVAFAHSFEERFAIQNPDLITGFPFTFSCMFKIGNTDPLAYRVILSNFVTLGSKYFELAVEDSSGTGLPGVLVALMKDGSNTRWARTDIHVDDNVPHHFAFVATAAASPWVFYVDGVEVSQNTEFTGGSGNPAWPGQPTGGKFTIGNYADTAGVGDFGFGGQVGGSTHGYGAPGAADDQIERGTIDEPCFWNGIDVGATRIAAHSLAALTGWEGEDTGARVTRFLDVLDWPATLRDIDTGISTLGPAKWSAGSTALAALQAWADTELGAFFIGKSGEIVWRSRHYPLLTTTATTSQATFGDDISGVTLKYNDVDLTRDEAIIRNPVTASRENGVSVTVKDDTLIEKYGDRSYAMVNSQDQLDSAIRDRALWGLARWKELGTRLKSVTITPPDNAANLWPQALGRELGDRVTITRTPLKSGNQISVDQIIERIEHTFTPFTWTTTFSGSPVDPNVGNYLILDDASFGLLDTGLLAY